MNSAEEHRLLEAPLYHPPREDLHVEYPVTEYPPEASDDGSCATALEHPASSGLPSLPRSLTYLNGLALVIGHQIGSGIFSAPSAVGTLVPSHAVGVSVWFLAGVLVWTGASSFIELGTRVPQNGGIQEYLRYCYGDTYGFLFAWVWLLVSRPCAMAMVALVFSEYLFKAVSPDHDVSTWILKAAALIAIVLITYLNCMGTHVGTGTANFFLVLKVFGLGSIAVVGLALAFTGTTHHDGSHQPNVTEHGSFPPPLPATSDTGHSWIWMGLGNFTDAVLAALFAYGGWESIGFVIGEMKEPQRTLPRVLNSSMAMVITLFILSTFAFYNTLSLEVLQKTNAIAVAFGMEIFGRPGALFYAWIVCLSCLGALNAIVFSTGRLTQAAGARHYLPAFLKAAADFTTNVPRHTYGRKSPGGFFSRICLSSNHAKDQNIPINAMALNATVAAIYVLAGSFRGLLSFKGMIEYVVYLTTVSGVLLLRFRPQSADKESLSRLYLTPIFNPVVFCCVATLIVIRSTIAHVPQALIIVLIFGTGSLVYRSSWWQKLVSTTAATDSD